VQPRQLLFLGTWILTLFHQPPLPAQDPARQEWFVVQLLGKPAGYVQVTELRGADGGAEVTTFTRLRVQREAQTADVRLLLRTEEDARGRLLRFVMEQELSKERLTVRGEVKGAQVVLSTSSGAGPGRSTSAPCELEAAAPHRAERIACDKLVTPGAKEGDTIEVAVFLPELQRSGRQRSVLGPVEETALLDGSRKLRRVTSTLDFLPGTAFSLWVDPDSRQVLKTSVPFFGMELVSIRASRETALRSDFRSPPDLMLASSIAVAKPLPPAVEDVVYLLRFRRPQSADSRTVEFPRAAGQEVLHRDGGASLRLRVRSVQPRGAVLRPVAPPEGLSATLAPSAYIDSDHPVIRDLARQVVAGERDAWKAAQRLERWVFENVRGKNLSTAFASAGEVAKTREGDCTEHAVLLAALARASGIPARVVVGLVHHRGAFVGHMWCEVFAGEWAPLDGTRGRGKVDADHIALGTSHLDTSSVADVFLALLPVLGNLEIEVLEAR
jgi:hypothetical protein